MTRIRTLKTNFTAGEVSPELLGRGDLTAFENGAARLRNVFIHPTGGVSRRPGTRYVATARGRLDRITTGVTPTAPSGGTAANALDDDPATLLSTTATVGTTDPYVVVQYDLGSARPVLFADAIGLRLTAGESAGEFRIQHSNDGVAWTDFGAVTNVGTRAEGFRRTGPVAARYWRLARIGGTDLGTATVELADFTLWVDTGAVSPGRAIAFEFNTEQTYLLVVTDRNIAVYADDAWVADLPSPVDADRIAQIAWAQSADTLLVVHADLPPMRFTRATIATGGGPVEDWKLSDWQFVLEDSKDADDNPLGTALRQPYHKFADADVTLTPSGTTLDSSITLTASAAVFQDAHVGMRFRIEERQVEITAVSAPTTATATVKEVLKSTEAAKDWEEPALSSLRGWPASVVFHQDRLVIGGARDLPNRLWLSKSGDLFNFDLGEGLDDAAIEFADPVGPGQRRAQRLLRPPPPGADLGRRVDGHRATRSPRRTSSSSARPGSARRSTATCRRETSTAPPCSPHATAASCASSSTPTSSRPIRPTTWRCSPGT